jgi:hypothetical protein
MLARPHAGLQRHACPARASPRVSTHRARCQRTRLAAKKGKEASIDEFLGTVLRDEVKIEKERYRQSEELMDGPPKPWKVDDRPMTNVITLARTHKEEELLVRAADVLR